jgi:putative ABC transport system permease protein
VLTETLARKYFGTTAALGQRLRVMDRADVTVTGVIRDLPINTHLSVSGLVSLNAVTAAFGPAFLENWNSSTDFFTYFRLRDGADVASIAAAMPAFLTRHAGGEIASERSGMQILNIRDIHLRSDRDEEWQPHGSIGTVYSFALIAFGILVIACINFMSIATARSAQRAREVGMRKTLGASRGELISQFLGESALTALAAMVIAIMLAETLLPAFSNFAGIAFTLSWTQDTGLLAAVLGLTLFVAFFAGSYPAFFLSNFNTAKVLKGELTRGKQGLQFRNVLVVFQFSIAITLLVATVVIYQQRDFAATLDLGFDKDQVVILGSSAPMGFQQDWPLLKQQLQDNPAIENVSASHFLPFGFNDNQIPVARLGTTVSSRIQYMLVDFDFFETYGMDIVAGRSFTPELGVDSASTADAAAEADISLVINESAARTLGLEPGEGIGSRLSMVQFEGTLVGVVKDTYFETIRVAVRPLLFILAPPQIPNGLQIYREASVRVRADALPQALAHIDATWEALYPDQALNRRFLDQDFQAMYQAEAKQGQLFSYFSGIAILIACFGLFGLASFNAERRTKEIGVRKVMGGSVWSIVLLLTNDFSRLVLLANLIAWPVAYFTMNRWLENFAYRIDLTPLIFIGSGLIALCIAWVTVGGTAAKAASAKPVLALRYE